MGDMGDMFKVMKQHSKDRRSSNREQSPQLLRLEGIDFIRKNGGTHLLVYGNNDTTIDFWPGTGRWIPRNTGFAQFGVKNLIKYVQES